MSETEAKVEVTKEETAPAAKEEIKAEKKVEEKKAEPKKEDIKKEEPKKEEPKKAEPKKAEPKVSPEDAKEAEKSQAREAAKKEEAKKPQPKKEEPKKEWQFVENLIIYPYTGALSTYIKFTGNIKVVGEHDGYKKVQYMRHGFGLVEGFTDKL